MAPLTRRLLLATASLLAAQALSPSSAAAEVTPVVAPLSQAHQRLLRAIPSDPAPKKLVRGQHYLTSNEDHPERFATLLKGLGGVYVGVGAAELPLRWLGAAGHCHLARFR